MESLITLVQNRQYKKIYEGLKQGIYNIEETNENNSTAFIYAANQGEFDLLDNLYKAGCNIHQVNNFGTNALIACCNDEDTDFQKAQSLLKVFSQNKVKFNQLINFFTHAFNDYHLSDAYSEVLKQKICEEIIKIYGKEIKAINPQEIVEQFSGQSIFLNEYFKLFDNKAVDKHPVVQIVKNYLLDAQQLLKTHGYFGVNAQSSVLYDKEIKALIKEVGQQTEDLIAQKKPLLEGLNNIISGFCKKIHHRVPDTVELIKNMNQAYNECPEHTYYNLMTQLARCTDLDRLKNWMSSANLFDKKEKCLDMNQQQRMENLVNQYNLRGLYIDKSCNINQVLDNLEKAFKDITEFFQIRDDEIGQSELKISIENNNKNVSSMSKETTGGYNIITNTIFATEGSKISSTLLHEYTHYLQHLAYLKDRMSFTPDFDNNPEWKALDEILINTTVTKEEIIQSMPEYFQGILDTVLSLEQKEKVMDIAGKRLNGQYSEEQMIAECESLDIDTIYDMQFFSRNHFKDYIKAALIDKYASFDYNYWYLQDKEKERGYWQKPIEIHARLNQDLFDFHSVDATLTRTTFNASVEALKKLNENLVRLSRENVLARSQPLSEDNQAEVKEVKTKQIGNKILTMRELNENDVNMDTKNTNKIR
jgi:uncharacterized protein YqgQ